MFHVVGNRPCVARGECDEDELRTVAQRFEALLEAEGVALTGCPRPVRTTRTACAVTTPSTASAGCRDPASCSARRASTVSTSARSWLIGDSLDEIEAGVRAGCRTVLLDDGREREWRLSELRLPHHVADGLGEAALLILEDEHVLDWRRRAADAGSLGCWARLTTPSAAEIERAVERAWERLEAGFAAQVAGSLRALLARGVADPDDRADLHHLIGLACEELGDHEGMAAALVGDAAP